ncbi:hypothetical protein Celal_0152 [Cellulophaga algicola DSM 14237]|uniref:SH3b domain-containing protein n=1 Tax=Cellulophaga algicola (strain DSM 14237 / IC166 / ACAM 630) TaxID=688270 RepID=E6X7R2_CELAD|nr:hypothetical protein [Cellulophaga algicola]ADV47505.1 hypothetical protein Celal_0152 [Cellulophaga algicola DSM 14237]
MYKVLLIAIAILFLSWKHENPQEFSTKQTTTIPQNSKKFKFVIAESGLNYRSEPNGTILGKFAWREKVEYLYETGVRQKITDNYVEVEGTWVAVKQKNDTVFVFDYFLSDTAPYYSKTKLYYAEAYYSSILQPSKEKDIRQAFVNVSESFYMPKNFIERKDLRKDTIHFKDKQRREFLKRMNYSDKDSIFIYDLKSGIVKKHLVGNTPIMACISIYSQVNEAYKTEDYDQWDYQIGFNLGKTAYGGFAMIGKENPFIAKGLQPIIFEKMNSANIALNAKAGLIPENWNTDTISAYVFNYENTRFFMRSTRSYTWNDLSIKNTATKESFEVDISEGESSSKAPLQIKGEKYDFEENLQYVGRLFKNKPPVVFGFTFKSFGCPSINFIATKELPIYILCDNRH